MIDRKRLCDIFRGIDAAASLKLEVNPVIR